MRGIVDMIEAAQRGANGFVWGVSGYATKGYECHLEAAILQRLFKTFQDPDFTPSMVSGGGGHESVLGLSAVLAERHGIKTIGITPLQGMAHMAPRSHTIVYGHTYADREPIVAAVPDILLAVGGGGVDASGKPRGTLREVLLAEELGSIIVLMGQQSKDPNSLAQRWHRSSKLQAAHRQGRLYVAMTPSLQDVGNAVRDATIAAAAHPRFRSARVTRLKSLLVL